MRHLERIKFSVKEIVTNCASSFRDKELKDKFVDSAEFIERKSEEYAAVAKSNKWGKISIHDKVNGVITKEEMVKLYDQKFVKQSTVREKYYDKILATAKYGKCPICGIGQASTLDHYLAKTLYPTYAVTPDNLIPECRDCNSNKSNKTIENISEAPLHPYFDDVDKSIWLCADLLFKDDVFIAKYYVNPEIKEENPNLYDRFCTHLDLYKLKEAYSVQASTEMSENKQLWEKVNKQTGKQGLIRYFTECLESCEMIQKNTWKTALLRGLIKAVENNILNNQII